MQKEVLNSASETLLFAQLPALYFGVLFVIIAMFYWRVH